MIGAKYRPNIQKLWPSQLICMAIWTVLCAYTFLKHFKCRQLLNEHILLSVHIYHVAVML